MYVDSCIKATGKPPTYRQVVKEFKLESTSLFVKRINPRDN